MNPGRPDAELSPRLTGNGTGYRFEYRKAAGELIYTVQENPTLEGDWNPLAAAEHTDNAGLYWIELPTGATRDFFRLRVTLP